MDFFDKVAFVTAIVLPLFNIPLIMRMMKRRSSQDISLVWALGVWVCILLMAPSGLRSEDPVWRMFNIMNVMLFSCVAITTLYFRRKIK